MTSAAVIQALFVTTYLSTENLHKLLSFAFSMKNTFFVIISGFWTLMITFVLSEIILVILTVDRKGPHSTAWKVGYAFAISFPSWVFLYMEVYVRTGLHSRHAPQMPDIVRAAINTNARARF